MLRFLAVHEPDLAADPFEAGLEGICSEIWLVYCEEAQQLERLMQRDGLSAVEAKARMNAQWPLAKKRSLSDVLIDNRVSIPSEEHLKKSIQIAL